MNDNKEKYLLTEEDKKSITDTISEEVEKSKNLKVLADLPSNNGVEEHKPEVGYEKEVTFSVDPNSGERTVVAVGDVSSMKINTSDKLSEIGESLNNIELNDSIINPEDVKNVITEDSLIGKYNISDDAILELIKLINSYKESGKVTYKELPEEVKIYVDKFMRSQGVINNSVESNTFRNTITKSLLDEYITQIELNKCTDDFNMQIEKLYQDTKEELSPLIKEYSEHREEFLKNLTNETDDEEKKKLAEEVLDAINDAYEIDRLKKSARMIKIKSFDLEKPKRSFDSFLYKYRDTLYHIYDIYMCTNILHKHLVSNGIIDNSQDKYAVKVLVAFAKFCEKYKVSNPAEHAFMYFFTNNIVLLDVYSGEQYKNFAPKFLNNIKEFYELLK